MSEIQGLATPDTSSSSAMPPSTPSLPSQASSPNPPSLSLPSLHTLRTWAPLYLTKTDRLLHHLQSLTSTPGGTDTLLLTTCYTTLLTSTLLSSLSLARLHRSARSLIAKISTLPPHTTVIISTSSIPSSRLLIAAQRLRALSDLISDFRIFARLWGLLKIYQWGKRTWRSPHGDAVVRGIVYAQVVVNVLYQYLENGAYLSSKGVAGWSAQRQKRAWLWSSRFWMAHVGLDFVRLGREWALRKGTTKEKEVVLDGKGAVVEQGDQEWWRGWVRELLIDAAWAPLTLHWSLENGLLGDFWVGLLGSVAGVARLEAFSRPSN
jgi:hypothetical protein